MRFRVKDELFERFPTACIGLVVASNVRNDAPAPPIADLLREATLEVRQRYGAHAVRSEPAIVVWREAFSAVGINTGRYKTSVEALLTRVVKGDALPDLNPAVDLANALSLRFAVPIGAHDLDQLQGDLEVGPARDGLLFTPLGHVEQEAVEAGEYVYADQQEVRTRRWVWRQGDHTKVVAHARNIVFPIDGWVGITDAAVRAVQSELVRLLEAELGATTETFFLDRETREVRFGTAPALPREVIAGPDGFRMAGLGYLEQSMASEPTEPGTAPAPESPGASVRPIAQVGSGEVSRPGARDPISVLLSRATVDVVVREEVEARLRRGDRLRVKFGIDPTGSQVHLGHAVQLRKLRAFQDAGHLVCLVIGDFTAQIGDASDKQAMRQMLTEQQVYENLQTYRKQIAKVVDSDAVEWSFNADWLGPLRFKDVIGLASHFTVAQMLERENFTDRYASGRPIGLQEFLYPLMQGYDSVAMRADVEIGGTEQLFNLMAGRTLQRAFGQQPQAVMTLQLLLGTDGKKMSKTAGNCVFLDDAPKDMYGKLMSLPDEQILAYFQLASELTLDEIDAVAAVLAAGENPMQAKKRLAYEVTRLYHGPVRANSAQDEFERVVQRKEISTEVPERMLLGSDPMPIADLLVELGFLKSKSEARRKVVQGGVRIDGEPVRDQHAVIAVRSGMLVQFGKREFARLILPS